MSLKEETLRHMKYNLVVWECCGVLPPKTYKRAILVFATHLMEVLFLASLAMSCVTTATLEELFLALAYTAGAFCIFFRVITYYFNFPKLIKCFELMEALNERAKEFKEEYKCIESAFRESQMLFIFVCGLYNISLTFLEILMTFILPGRNSITPVWIPFIDWKHNYLSYALVNVFDYFGIIYQATNGACVDTEPAGNIILLTSHIKALRKRVSKIGWDQTKSKEENYDEFLDCITYHIQVLELFKELTRALSTRLLIIFIMSALTQCFFAVSIIYADSRTCFVLGLILVGSTMETFIPCFYGDNLIHENQKLVFAIGNCNWMDQHEMFKRDLILFTMNAQKPLRILPGGFLPCSMITFVYLQKLAYSIFVLFKK